VPKMVICKAAKAAARWSSTSAPTWNYAPLWRCSARGTRKWLVAKRADRRPGHRNAMRKEKTEEFCDLPIRTK